MGPLPICHFRALAVKRPESSLSKVGEAGIFLHRTSNQSGLESLLLSWNPPKEKSRVRRRAARRRFGPPRQKNKINGLEPDPTTSPRSFFIKEGSLDLAFYSTSSL